MVNIHGMQLSDPNQKIMPNLSSLVLAKLLLVFEHVVVEVETAGKILSDNIVVGFRFEEIDYFYDLGNLAGFLESNDL